MRRREGLLILSAITLPYPTQPKKLKKPPVAPKEIEIQAFLPDGTKVRRKYSLAQCLRLEEFGKVRLVRQNGKILSCHYLQADGAAPLPRTAHMGQHYSVNERLEGTSLYAWKHKDFPDPNRGCDLFIRRIFKRVQLDIFTDYSRPAEKSDSMESA